MAFSKANKYEDQEQLVAHFTHAFRHPARQKILKKLSKDGPCSVVELSKNHPISRATLSDHLKILRECQLVNWWEVFPSTYYTLNLTQLEQAKKCIKEFLDSLEI